MISPKLKAWIQASRPPFYIATIIPLAMGLVLTKPIVVESWVLFLWINLAAFLVHLATNLANDLFDHYQGADSGKSIGGSRVIQEGKIKPRTLWVVITGLYLIAGLVAIYLTWRQDVFELWLLILFAFLSSVFYVAPPIRYGYRGLGELMVGINMGPVMVVGTHWTITGSPDVSALIISIPIGILVAAILYYQSLPDMETDAAVGKNTLAVKLGKTGAYRGMAGLGALFYCVVTILIISNFFNLWAGLILVSAPLYLRILQIIGSTRDWVDLDRYGYLIRLFYFLNGGILIMALLTI